MPEGEVYIKDLDLLNRDLSRTIIVDNLRENYVYHKDNGIEISSWYDDYSDRCLYHLGEILRDIHSMFKRGAEVFDIRKELLKRQSIIHELVSERR